MILTALDQYYRRVAGSGPDAPPPFGFAPAKVVGAIQLDSAGRFVNIVEQRHDDAKGRPQPRSLIVPQPPQRTVAVAPGFLCDNAGYLLGHDRKGKPERVRQQWQASAALHRQLLDGVDHPAARAILGHFATWDPETAAEKLAPFEEFLDGWLVFLAGPEVYAHDALPLREAWARHREAATSTVTGQCLVSGAENVPLARLHPAIKGIPGAQTAGASLVSFNIDAATSYGKEQSFNAPVSEAAAFGYTTALNHLLRRGSEQRRALGEGLTLVWWAARACAGERQFGRYLDPTAEDDEDTALDLKDGLTRLSRGELPIAFEPDQDVAFFVLGLSPNAARLSVRFWMVDTLGQVLRNVGDHQHDLSLVTDYDNRPPHPSIYALVQETRAKGADGHPRGRADRDRLDKLQADLLRAVLTGGPYPASLLPVLLARLRADGFVSHPRVALLKALVNRPRRLAHQKELPMALDESRDEVGYRLGRLFAALERLQEAAHGQGTLNNTIRDKFLGSAAATPRPVFNHLLRLSEAHRKKARRDHRAAQINADKVIEAVMVDLTDLPATLSPENQALFFLGYYQQRKAFFTGKQPTDQTLSEPSHDRAE